jgi:hypothetical protein
MNGVRRFSAGWDIDCGLAAALYARLVLHKWSWADTLMVHVSVLGRRLDLALADKAAV